MGQHKEKSARLEDKCAWMREQQRLKKEAAKAGAVLVSEENRAAERAVRFSERVERKLTRLKARAARESGAVVAPVKTNGPAAVGFTWGKPLPRRTDAEMQRVWRKHRREKKGNQAS